ncbi:unnamed protein product [Albugo candida]|uniref:Uncharacterized protein n=1 Tax=Albugo candida TaxID=65357 RepID=A0A024FXQ5_9STRA|nr:unnamed protein product [Albugo candida]|eukprot:CCI11434.1 unnamed protein product [Albugo candida]
MAGFILMMLCGCFSNSLGVAVMSDVSIFAESLDRYKTSQGIWADLQEFSSTEINSMLSKTLTSFTQHWHRWGTKDAILTPIVGASILHQFVK